MKNKMWRSDAIVVGAVVVTAALGWMERKPPARAEERGQSETRETAEKWHRAGTKAEAFARVKARLSAELEAVGIDASNVWENAKGHPARLVRPVPEHEAWHPRLRLLVLSEEDEAKIARDYVKELREADQLADAEDPAGLARVARIVGRLAPVVREIGQMPEIHLVKDRSVNAFCLPDGTTAVHTGTLAAVPDDDLLAAILAHELGHAAARHGNEGVSRALEVVAAGVVVEEWATGLAPILDTEGGVSAIRFLYGLGTKAGYTAPRSRAMEAEADRLGVRYLARAGYDPAAMERLFAWFDEIAPENKNSLSALLRSHPFHDERAAHVREVLLEPDLGQPLAPTLAERAGNLATNVPPGLAGMATNFPASAAAMATNLKSRLPKIPFPRRAPAPDADN